MPFTNPFKRSGTKTSFSTKGKEAEVKLPSPKDTDLKPQSTEHDKEIATGEQLDEIIQEKQGRDKTQDKPEASSDKKAQNIVKNNEALTHSGTTTSATPDGIYSLYWDNSLHLTFAPRTYPKIARYIPNAMAMMEILNQTIPMVARTQYVQKHQATFNPYAVAVGYSIVYYLQILRAKHAASDIDGIESSLLKRFFAAHPEESIPIASPLFPYFNTIAATELEDRRYDWIVPDYHFDGMTDEMYNLGPNNFQSFSTKDGLCFVQPQVPYMLAILSEFGTLTETELQARLGPDGTYTPIALGNTTAFFHYTGTGRPTFATGTTTFTDAHHIPTSCGTSFPFRFYNQNATDACRYMSEGDFYGRKGINFRAIGTGTRNIDSVGTWTNPNFNNIDSFLALNKDRNPRWFTYVKEQMQIYADHWITPYNLSQVGKTAGLETSIILHLRTEDEMDATTHRHTFTDINLNMANTGLIKWYQNRFPRMTAHASSGRAEIGRSECLQAFTFATNSSPPIEGITQTNYRTGKVFAHGSTEAGEQLYIGQPELKIPGPIDLFNWRSLYPRIFKKDPKV